MRRKQRQKNHLKLAREFEYEMKLFLIKGSAKVEGKKKQIGKREKHETHTKKVWPILWCHSEAKLLKRRTAN